jgi:hypothetical protein
MPYPEVHEAPFWRGSLFYAEALINVGIKALARPVR